VATLTPFVLFSTELLANSQYVNREAYKQLTGAVYPLSLPFNQPAEVARVYLEQLGSSCYEILRTFKLDGGAPANASLNEIYVLGEVTDPGVLRFAPNPTVVRAIAARGGYSTKAFKRRVLVVRGSLTNPELHVVDTAAVLAGKEPDFKLQPRDIVYVSTNPWVLAAEVLDLAARTFVQSLMVEVSTLRVPLSH